MKISIFEGTSVMIIYIGPLFTTSKFQQVVYCAERGDTQHPTQFPFCFSEEKTNKWEQINKTLSTIKLYHNKRYAICNIHSYKDVRTSLKI